MGAITGALTNKLTEDMQILDVKICAVWRSPGSILVMDNVGPVGRMRLAVCTHITSLCNRLRDPVSSLLLLGH